MWTSIAPWLTSIRPTHIVRRVVAEPAVFFGAGRALLLQVAHPSVAQGVADHSEFQANPFKRLFGTLEATYAVDVRQHRTCRPGRPAHQRHP